MSKPGLRSVRLDEQSAKAEEKLKEHGLNISLIYRKALIDAASKLPSKSSSTTN